MTPEIFEAIVKKVGVHGATLWSDKNSRWQFEMDFKSMAEGILEELNKQGHDIIQR